MSPKYLCLLVLLALPLLANAIGCGDPLFDVAKPINDINDPHVKRIAVFAVNENNRRTAANLALQSVVSGTYAHSDDVHYVLTVAVSGPVTNYEADVVEDCVGSDEGDLNAVLYGFKPTQG